MKARVSSQPRQWTSAKLRVVPTGMNNTHHNRVKVIITQPDGSKIFLQLQDSHAYALSDAIIDAMEAQSKASPDVRRPKQA